MESVDGISNIPQSLYSNIVVFHRCNYSMISGGLCPNAENLPPSLAFPMKQIKLLVLVALGSSLFITGCDRTVSKTEETKVKSDGTVESKEKKVTENPDGSVTKTETKKTDKP